MGIWQAKEGVIMMNPFNQSTTHITMAPGMRRSVAVLVMHFYNFDHAPKAN